MFCLFILIEEERRRRTVWKKASILFSFLMIATSHLEFLTPTVSNESNKKSFYCSSAEPFFFRQDKWGWLNFSEKAHVSQEEKEKEEKRALVTFRNRICARAQHMLDCITKTRGAAWHHSKTGMLSILLDSFVSVCHLSVFSVSTNFTFWSSACFAFSLPLLWNILHFLCFSSFHTLYW